MTDRFKPARTPQRNPRQLTDKSSLDNLKKEAKRWLKALHAGDDEARARLVRANPNTPTEPKLRDVQYALAIEHGLSGWSELRKQLEELALHTELENPASGEINKNKIDSDQLAALVDRFLEYACADPILNNGPAAHARRARAALRILTRYPEIGRANIHTAVVCGDLEEVERILREQPEAAREPGGPLRRRQISERQKRWTPLLHLCYGRLPTAAASDNAVAIARVLLDSGADPDEYFEVGSQPYRYTTLCGVAGEGEDGAPPHPQKEALARLLLERGAEPYDIQVIYNIHFNGNVRWFLELIYEFSVKAGRQVDWDDPNWSMLNMGNYGSGARWHLDIAIAKNDFELARWILEHGANPDSGPAVDPRFMQRTPLEEAQLRGYSEIADLLLRFGATPTAYVREGIEAFSVACFRLDRREAQALMSEHPEYLLSPVALFAASERDRPDVVEFLLDLGMSTEVEDAHKTRALHQAASYDSLRVAKLLIERGAENEPVGSMWNNTPLDAALYHNLPRMIELLSSYTRDVFRLTWIGNIDRLREVLSDEPGLAKVNDEGNTPLMWLPEDELSAIEIVELLIANGADPNIKNKEGMTAAGCAEQRGLYDVAELLRALERVEI